MLPPWARKWSQQRAPKSCWLLTTRINSEAWRWCASQTAARATAADLFFFLRKKRKHPSDPIKQNGIIYFLCFKNRRVTFMTQFHTRNKSNPSYTQKVKHNLKDLKSTKHTFLENVTAPRYSQCVFIKLHSPTRERNYFEKLKQRVLP